jgi:hypothetical protein
MSNWSTVMIAFSGVDDEVKDGSKHPEENRIRQIMEKHNTSDEPGVKLYGPMISYSCSEKSIAYAYDVVAIFHANHFHPDHLAGIIQSFEWEYPVQIIWKDLR